MPGELTPAVVLDLGFGGYGIVRSLVRYGIPVIGFYNQQKMPEFRTKLCDRKVYFNGETDLKNKLKHTASGLACKPVLFITTDSYVSFVIENRTFIDEHFLIHLPSNDVLNLLLDKTAFTEYAIQHNILIPRTHNLFNQEDLDRITESLSFPVILKPFVRNANWRKANLSKAYYLGSIDELSKLYVEINPIESRLMVQEWIPGGDSNVYYCLVYFNELSECLASFTGYKIRQWPVGTGTGCSTEPVDNVYVFERAVEILKQVGYRGFGSVEFKLHELNGKYYLIEPTVGRVEQIGYVATANGVNLPLRCYNALTRSDLEETPPPGKKVIYLEELTEIASAFVHIRKGMITIKEYFRSLRGPKAYRYFNKGDLAVFMGLLLKVATLNFKKR
jgi:predicted ATP-grasp superfamily ATP-dependent carboligase